MIGAGIVNFLVKATGPSIMISDLRSRTKILGDFLDAIDNVNSLQTKITDSVIKGGLADLMSRKLQQLLDYSNQNDALENRNFADTQGFSDSHFPIEKVEEEKFSLDPELTEGSTKSLISNEQDSEIESDFCKGVSLRGENKIKESKSIFVEKIREYLCLNELEQKSQKRANKVTGMQKDEITNAPLFPVSSLQNSAKYSWPEMTGDQVANQIKAFATGREPIGSSKRMQQTLQANDSAKVQIHNTFDIRIGYEQHKDAESKKILTEKIGEILREQALQHGIDIS